MIKKLSYVCFKILLFIDKVFKFLTKKSFLIWFNDFIQDESYRSIRILNIKIDFFVQHQLTNYRIDTYFNK